jgi:hypothetical protein
MLHAATSVTAGTVADQVSNERGSPGSSQANMLTAPMLGGSDVGTLALFVTWWPPQIVIM